MRTGHAKVQAYRALSLLRRIGALNAALHRGELHTLLRQCTMYTSSSGNRQNLVAHVSMCWPTSTLSNARHTCSRHCLAQLMEFHADIGGLGACESAWMYSQGARHSGLAGSQSMYLAQLIWGHCGGGGLQPAGDGAVKQPLCTPHFIDLSLPESMHLP